MYYDANGADYISTPSFAIPNTGILTIEAWMKSNPYTNQQSLVGESNSSVTIGLINIRRVANSNSLYFQYVNGDNLLFFPATNVFTSLDNQWVHIAVVCDYANKVGKWYRNGVQFGTDATLTGTPLFPSTNRVKYIGAYGSPLNNIQDGSLDEVRIYNRGLSAEEIMSIYNQTKGKYE
jgi:hypothetical protein